MEQSMYVRPYDRRSRWIIIGGTIGATFGVAAHHVSVAIALGIAFGMSVGSLLNKMGDRRHFQSH